MSAVIGYAPHTVWLKLTARAALIGALVLSIGTWTSAQGSKTYKARLSVVPIDVAMQAIIAGSGTVTAVLAGNKLTINGTYDGLRSAATIAQVHRGQRGVRGPVIPGFDLKVSGGTSGTITGTLDLTPAQTADLDKGWLYIQLHSEKAPEGNLWGWPLLQENRK
jgi:hypothetical protein